MKKKVKTPLLAQVKAIATKLRLRVTKGLRKAKKEVPEAFTEEPHQDPAKEAEILDRALKAMPPLARGELEKRLAGDPGPRAVGDTVFIPFIGSETEERGLDVKTTAYTIPQYQKMQRIAKQRTTCERCAPNGLVPNPKCPVCGGKGWRKARPGDDR